MTHPAPTALMAEDEPLLAMSLAAELKKAWPELQLLATVGNGHAAVEEALARRPDVLFLDIRMPGSTGLEAAQALSEDWPDDEPLPLIVFVTAYEQYAVAAFERSAVDYVLKPVQPERLALTCQRLRAALDQRGAARGAHDNNSGSTPHGNGSGEPAQARSGQAPAPWNTGDGAPDAMLQKLQALLASSQMAWPEDHAGMPPRLKTIQASQGNTIHMVRVDEVVYFEAADKYVRVLTADKEYLIRTPLKELVPQLDPQTFWQIHRGTLVRQDAISAAVRDESGRVSLTLRGRPEKLGVSRLYAPRFKPM